MPARGNTEPNVKSTALALTAEARAKVNLTLRVVGRRVDGYHDLESVVAFADCADRLSLTPGPQLHLSTTGPLAQACGEAADNLVFKAAQLLGERVRDLKLGDFTLEKVLPVAAGIGGGSADAAAAARLLGDLEAPAMRIQPVISEVLAALNATNGAWLARMSGSGATCFAIFENTAEAQRASQMIQQGHPQWWVHAGVLG